ncbi:hypothetical protein [Vibrio sp. 10N.239.312.D08]|uniref:DUF7146 domain-containing protein n=1 Tax=Vibrio sp. 10N.239.312.D08 TaxID=3229978 RepID=UPI003552E29C
MYQQQESNGAYVSQPIPEENDVFKLVSRIPNFVPVYTHWGLADYVNKKPLSGKPCPKNPGKKSSTKFRFRKGFEQHGRWHHNDIDSGSSQGPIDFAKWYFGIGDDIDAAMEVLNAAGVDFTDLRGTGYKPQTTLNPIAQTPLTSEQIAQRKQEEFDDSKRSIISISKAWNKGLAISHPTAKELLDKHLQSRGLPAGHVEKMPQHIRVNLNMCYHASLRKNSDKNAFYAAWLVPVVERDGRNVTVHRHFIDKKTGGKIPEENRKLMMSPPWDLPHGSRLEYDKPLRYQLDNGEWAVHFSLGEGCETMEAVRVIMGDIPVQPMMSTGFLQNFEPSPEDIEGIKPENVFFDIWIDKDQPNPHDPQGRGPGEIAADVAIERLTKRGFNCMKVPPPIAIPHGAKGVDWLDVYNAWTKEQIDGYLAELFG